MTPGDVCVTSPGAGEPARLPAGRRAAGGLLVPAYPPPPHHQKLIGNFHYNSHPAWKRADRLVLVVCATVPVLILFVLIERRVVGGLTAGSIR